MAVAADVSPKPPKALSRKSSRQTRPRRYRSGCLPHPPTRRDPFNDGRCPPPLHLTHLAPSLLGREEARFRAPPKTLTFVGKTTLGGPNSGAGLPIPMAEHRRTSSELSRKSSPGAIARDSPIDTPGQREAAISRCGPPGASACQPPVNPHLPAATGVCVDLARRQW